MIIKKKLQDLFAVFTIVAINSYIYQNIFLKLNYGDPMDGTLQMVLHEHWFSFLNGHNSFLETNFYFPAKNTLGYSDVFLIQGPIHSFFRYWGFNVDFSWSLTTFLVLVVGNVGWYLVSNLLLKKFIFKLIFVILMSLNYTLVAYMSSQANSASYALLSYFILVILKINKNLNNKVIFNRYLYLLILFLGVSMLSNWYLTFFMTILSIIFITLSFYLNKNYVKIYVYKFFKNIHIHNYLINLLILTPLLFLFLIIYLPVKSDPIRSKTDLLGRSQNIFDLFNGTYPKGGGLYSKFYSIFNFEYNKDYLIGIGLISGCLLILFVFNIFVKLIRSRKSITFMDISLLSTFLVYIFFLELINGFSIFGIFYELIPGFNSIRDTFRFNIILNYILILYLIIFLEKIQILSRYSKLITALIIIGIFLDQFRFPIRGWDPNTTINSGLETQTFEIKNNCDYLYFDAPGGWWYDQAVAMRFSQVHSIPTVNGNSGGWPNQYPYMDFSHDGDISGIINWMDKIQDKVGCFSNGELPVYISDSKQPRVNFEGGFTPVEKIKDFEWQWSISNKSYLLAFSPDRKDLQIQFDAKSSKCNENSVLEVKNYLNDSIKNYNLNSNNSNIKVFVGMNSKKFNKLELNFNGAFCNIENDPRNLYYQVSNLDFSRTK